MAYRGELSKRIRCPGMLERLTSPEDAALLIDDGMTVAVGGYTPAGYPKVVPLALSRRAQASPGFGINLIAGANVGPEVDAALAGAGAIKRRLPFQSDAVLRKQINEGKIKYVEAKLGKFPLVLRAGWLGKIDVAIVEATAITEDGQIVPSTSVGPAAVFVSIAEKVIVEVNVAQPARLEGFHDVYLLPYPPDGSAVPLKDISDRIGTPWIPVEPDKVVAVVESTVPDPDPAFGEPDPASLRIAQLFVGFLEQEIALGRLPRQLPPIQPGLGALADALLRGMARSRFRGLRLFGGVLQDGGLELLEEGVADIASAGAITPSAARLERIAADAGKYRRKLVLRSSDVTNNPEVIRRLGLIATNSAIEVDIYGHANVSHLLGSQVVNGIGGGCEFAREGLLSVFFLNSVARGGKISCIVPMVSHVDHTEHDVDVIITEQGIADLRGLDPEERAVSIIQNCAHPDWRPFLWEYLAQAKRSGMGHEPHCLSEALSWHVRLHETGSMRPGAKAR